MGMRSRAFCASSFAFFAAALPASPPFPIMHARVQRNPRSESRSRRSRSCGRGPRLNRGQPSVAASGTPAPEIPRRWFVGPARPSLLAFLLRQAKNKAYSNT